VPCIFPTVRKAAEHPSLRSVHVFRAKEPKTPEQPPPTASTPRAVGGILSSINCLQTSPIEQTERNSELMDFCIFSLTCHSLSSVSKETNSLPSQVIGYVSPNLVSIDGRDPPVIFRTLMLPWMLQSPMFPKIALLMASLAQVREMGRHNAAPEALVLKAKVLRMVNAAVAGIHDRADIWRCVIHLVIVEVCSSLNVALLGG